MQGCALSATRLAGPTVLGAGPPGRIPSALWGGPHGRLSSGCGFRPGRCCLAGLAGLGAGPPGPSPSALR
eukprot:8169620-Pyramimonas_sp.AAC.1